MRQHPTKENESAVPTPAQEVTLKDLAVILVKHFELHEGLYEVGFRFNVGIGNLGLSPDDSAPGALFTIGGVGLSKSTKPGPITVDAAEVNPAQTLTRTPVSTKRTGAKRTA